MLTARVHGCGSSSTRSCLPFERRAARIRCDCSASDLESMLMVYCGLIETPAVMLPEARALR